MLSDAQISQFVGLAVGATLLPLGWFFIVKLPRDKRLKAALAQWHEAASRGDAEAMYRLGIAYETGKGAKRNQTMATQWYSKAAESEHIDAIYEIAIRLRDGNGVAKNVEKAKAYFELAASRGDEASQHRLHEM